MAAGGDDRSFWRQTPASHAAIMRGRGKQRQIEIEERVVLDHLSAKMNALANNGKLAAVGEYLKAIRPEPKATTAAMLATMKDFAARNSGVSVNVRPRVGVDKPKE